MTCRRQYKCDLCHDEIRDATGGIGILWSSGNAIHNVLIPDSEHHLCNRCIEALGAMLEDIKRMTAIYSQIDKVEAQS
jgi:hypothetical protein